MPGRITRASVWGSAILALPFLFSAPLFADNYSAMMMAQGLGQSSPSSGGLEASWTTLALNRDALNAASAEAGFPSTSVSAMQLWGGGAAVEKGATRYGATAMTGGLDAESGSQSSNWNLDMFGLYAEQRYPSGNWEVTAGFYVGYGQFSLEFRGPGSVITGSGYYSRYDSRFIATGSMVGLRWPTTGSVNFFLRSGYFWLPASGAWKGDLAGKMATTNFNLNAPFGQAGLDLKF